MNRFDVTVIVANFNDAEKVSLQLSRSCDTSMVVVAHHRALTNNDTYKSTISHDLHQFVIRDTIDIERSTEQYFTLCSEHTCIKSKLVVFSPNALLKIKDKPEYKFTVNKQTLSINGSYCFIGEKEFYHLTEKIIGFNSHNQYERIEDLMSLLRADDIITDTIA